MAANPTLEEVFSLGDKQKPDEEYLQEVVEKMFLTLDTEENKENLTNIIIKIG